MATRRKAATTRLQPGEHSIDRNTPTQRVLKGQSVIVLDWSVRLNDGQLIKDRRTQGKTATDVRRKAKLKARDLLATGGQRNRWTPSTPIELYLDEVSTKEIDESGCRPASITQYRRVLKLLRGQLVGHSISSAWKYDVLVDALNSIAAANGVEAAQQSRTVLSRYVAQPLRQHRLVDHYPLWRVRLSFARHAPKRDITTPKRGGQALSAADQEQVIVHLLNLDPAQGVLKPKRGRWTLEDRIRKRQSTIDLTLLQAGTALRISEALQITVDLVEVDSKGVMHVNVTKDIAKTGVARRTPVADPRITKHFVARLDAAKSPDEYVVGAPADPQKMWSRAGNGGATAAVANLYMQLAEDLDIPLLQHARSHVWRTTLSSRYHEAGVHREDYAAILGHDEKTNERSYTDRTDTGAAVAAYRSRLDSA